MKKTIVRFIRNSVQFPIFAIIAVIDATVGTYYSLIGNVDNAEGFIIAAIILFGIQLCLAFINKSTEVYDKKHQEFEFVRRNLKSCENLNQLRSANNMICAFSNKWNDLELDLKLTSLYMDKIDELWNIS